MNTQGFKMAKEGSQDILYQEVRKRKRPLSLFFAILPMLLLFSSKKGMTELPGHANAEIILSNQSFHAAVSRFEESDPFNRTLFVPCGNGGAGEELTLTGSLKIDEHIIYNDRGFTFTFHI